MTALPAGRLTARLAAVSIALALLPGCTSDDGEPEAATAPSPDSTTDDRTADQFPGGGAAAERDGAAGAARPGVGRC